MKKFEDFEYNLIDSESCDIEMLSMYDFVKAGLNKAMRTYTISIDIANKIIVLKLEDFCNII